MIGTGIFLKPAEMAREAGSTAVVFAAWIVGGVLSMFGALSFAELGAEIPEAGGEYAYLRRLDLSPVCWDVLFGWTHSIVGRPSSTASIAAGLMRFVGFLFPAIAAPIYTLHLQLPFSTSHHSDFAFTWAQPLAVLALILLTFINYLGVRLGGQVQIGLTIIKIVSVGAIIGFGFFLSRGSASNFQPIWPTSLSWSTATGFLAALAAALWVFDGWEDLNLVGSEIRDPGRNIPRALIGGVAFVIVLFSAFSAVCFYALPFDVVAASQHVASDVVESFAGRGAAVWVTLAMVISSLGTLNSSVLSGARVDYAMARDGIFSLRFAGATSTPNFELAGKRADFSMLPRQRDGFDGNVRRPHFSFYLRRMDFLRLSCCRAIPSPPHRAQYAPALQDLGLSGSATHFYRRRNGTDHQHLGSAACAFINWPGFDVLRSDFLSVLEQTDSGVGSSPSGSFRAS